MAPLTPPKVNPECGARSKPPEHSWVCSQNPKRKEKSSHSIIVPHTQADGKDKEHAHVTQSTLLQYAKENNFFYISNTSVCVQGVCSLKNKLIENIGTVINSVYIFSAVKKMNHFLVIILFGSGMIQEIFLLYPGNRPITWKS